MRKIIVAATIAASLAVPATSFAGANTNVTTSNASCDGMTHAASSWGADLGNTKNGGFGLGADGGSSDHGTLAGVTGYNNSHVNDGTC